MLHLKLTYTNPLGRSIVFDSQRGQNGEHPPYLLRSVTGVGGPDTEYENIQLTGSDGSAIGPTRYPARFIRTECMIFGETDAKRDTALRNALGVLNPKLGDGTISYVNHENEYRITAKCVSLPSFGANTRLMHWKPVLIDYVCKYPYFRGIRDSSMLIAASDEIFRLPFTLPFTLGSQKYEAVVNNKSSISVPMEVIIYGPAVNPRLTSDTTGDTIFIRKSIASGERLIVTTGPFVSVKIHKSDSTIMDAMNYVNLLNTNWIQLVSGMNGLTYASDDASKNTRIEVHWSDWYLGVG